MFSNNALSGAAREGAVIACLYVLAVSCLLAGHDMWHDEAQQYLIVKASRGLPDLIGRLRYEGHPALWYLLLYPVYKCCDTVEAAKIPNLVVSGLTVALFLMAILKSRTERILFPLGYFLIWQYSTVSRSYMLGFLLTGLACFLMSRRRNPALVFLVLGLLGNVHLYFLVMAGCLAGLYLWEERERLSAPERRKSAIGGIFMMGMLFLAAVAEIGWSARSGALHADFHPGAMLSFLDYALLPLRTLPAIAMAPLSLLLIFSLYACWRVSRPVGVFLVVSTLVIALLQSLRMGATLWHIGTIYIAVLVAVIAARDRAAPEARRELTLLLAVLFLLQAVAGGVALGRGLGRPYSNGRAAATYLAQACPGGCVIVTALIGGGPTISAYLGGRPLYDTRRQDFATYEIGDDKERKTISVREAVESARRFPKAVMVFNMPLDDDVRARLGLRQLAAFDGAYMEHEDFYIYALAPSP